MDPRDLLDRIGAVAAPQHGIIGVRQIHGIGVSRTAFDAIVRRGHLRRVGNGTYSVVGVPDTWHHRLWWGYVELGDDVIISHESAARLHQLDRSRTDAVEFTVPRRRRSAPSRWTVHSTSHLGRIDVVQVDGFRVTSATRTVIDLARARVPRVRLEAAIDSSVRLGLSSPFVLTNRLAELRGPGRWGARLLDELLVDSGGHTLLERRFLQIVREWQLPRPLTQVVHRVGGRTIARVDFLFEEYGIVVEVSGQKGHSSPSERARDAQRRNELQDLGRAVYEYTWNDVTSRAAIVGRSLRDRLVAAGWQPHHGLVRDLSAWS